MRWTVFGALATALLAAGCVSAPEPQQSAADFLFVWAGDKDGQDEDFLAVVDLRLGSTSYDENVARLPLGAQGTMPHHVEYEFPKGGMLFADGWVSGLTSLIDLHDPLKPKLVKRFTDMKDMSFPHSYARLDAGNVLVTL